MLSFSFVHLIFCLMIFFKTFSSILKNMLFRKLFLSIRPQSFICIVANRELPGSIILYRVNKTSGIFWLTKAFTKLHAFRLQGENLLFEENVSRVNM